MLTCTAASTFQPGKLAHSAAGEGVDRTPSAGNGGAGVTVGAGQKRGGGVGMYDVRGQGFYNPLRGLSRTSRNRSTPPGGRRGDRELTPPSRRSSVQQ